MLILIPGAVSSVLRFYFGGKRTLGSPGLPFSRPQSFLLCSVLQHSGRCLGIPERKQAGIAFFQRNPRAGSRNSCSPSEQGQGAHSRQAVSIPPSHVREAWLRAQRAGLPAIADVCRCMLSPDPAPGGGRKGASTRGPNIWTLQREPNTPSRCSQGS